MSQKSVAFNQSMRGQDYWGFGIIQQTPFNNLDSKPDNMMMKGGNPCMKEEIRYRPKEKVHRTQNNTYTDYFNESVDDYNYEEKQQLDLDRGLAYQENAENQNLDFDNDGRPDINLEDTKFIVNPKATEATEALMEGLDYSNEDQHHPIEQELDPDPPSKPIKEDAEEAPVNIHGGGKEELGGEQEMVKKYEKPRNQLKSVEANRNNKSTMSMADGVIMGAGSLALAMMILGRAQA